MKKVITDNAEQFIESLFERQKIKSRALNSSKLKFTGEQFRNKKGYEHDYRVFMFTHFLKFYKKYSRNFNYEEFIGVYSVALTEACAVLGERFPDFRDFKYDKKVQMGAMRYLKVVIENSLYRLNNPDSVQTRVKDKNVFVHADVTSLDAIQDAYREHDNEFELSDENNLWDIDKDRLYEFNYYIQHFILQKDRIMTKKQADYYEAIKKVYVAKNSEITKKEMLKEAGYTQAQHHKYMLNIAKRAEADFEIFGKKKAINEDYRSKLHRVLNNFIEVADSDENIRNIQMNLSRIISENYDESEDFEMIILEGLNTEEKIHVVRVVKGKHFCSNKVLYKIYNNIYNYLEQNEMIEVKASEVKSTYSESIIGEKKEDNASNHYRIDAKGSTHSVSFEDIVEEGEEHAVHETMQ